MIYLGIDPGVSGGLAVLNDSAQILRIAPMPKTARDVFDWLSDVQHEIEIVAALEKVSSSPQMGVVSAFTFGKGVGGLKMALAALRIPYLEVRPQEWQSALNCLTKGDKNVSKARAQGLFPSVPCTHATADALLIAEWLRRTGQG